MLIRVTCSHVWAVGVGSDATKGNNQADFAEEGAVVWQRGVRPARGVHHRCLPPRSENVIRARKTHVCRCGTLREFCHLVSWTTLFFRRPFARIRFGRQGLISFCTACVVLR